jgi:hypothetical protein
MQVWEGGDAMKYLLEVPPEVRAKIKYVAALQGTTMNALILKAVIEFLEKDGAKNGRTMEASKGL